MKKIIALGMLMLSTSIFAKPLNLKEYANIETNLSIKEGVSLLKDFIEEGRYVRDQKGFIFSKPKKYSKYSISLSDDIKKIYPKGDFVIMWSLGANETNIASTKNEYLKMWGIMEYLSNLNFRVILNIQSSIAEIKDAVERDTTSVMIISAHGNELGFYDVESQLVPKNIFVNKGKNLYQVILSACYGAESRENYVVPSDLLYITWRGLTVTSDLMNYLLSTKWDANQKI